MTRGWAVAVACGLAIGACGKPRKAARRDDAAGAVLDAAVKRDAREVREVVILRDVDVDVVAPSDGPRPDAAVIAARLRRLGTAVVATAKEVPAGWAGRGGTLEAVVTYDLGGSARAPLVLMTVEATLALDGDALGAAARAAGERPVGGARVAAVEGLAASLVEQVAGELEAKLTLRAAPRAALIDAARAAVGMVTRDAGPAVVDEKTVLELGAWALELAAERGDGALRDVAIAALGRSTRLRTAGIQYLVALRDPATVQALAASVDFADPEEMAQVIEAVTAIGGDDARAFLEMLAAGASDADEAARPGRPAPALKQRAAADGLRRVVPRPRRLLERVVRRQDPVRGIRAREFRDSPCIPSKRSPKASARRGTAARSGYRSRFRSRSRPTTSGTKTHARRTPRYSGGLATSEALVEAANAPSSVDVTRAKTTTPSAAPRTTAAAAPGTGARRWSG